MSIRRAAVQRDFSLRPGSRSFPRAQLPDEPMEEAEPLPAGENFPPTMIEDAQNSPVEENPPGWVAQDAPDDDHSSAIDPDDPKDPENPPGPEISVLPPHFPPCPLERPTPGDIALWHRGCLAMQDYRGDGFIHAVDVVYWMATRNVRAANRWPMLEEGQRAIESMREETLDIEAVRRRRQEDEETARLAEEHRQRNKRRYRPRAQIERERMQRRQRSADH